MLLMEPGYFPALATEPKKFSYLHCNPSIIMDFFRTFSVTIVPIMSLCLWVYSSRSTGLFNDSFIFDLTWLYLKYDLSRLCIPSLKISNVKWGVIITPQSFVLWSELFKILNELNMMVHTFHLTTCLETGGSQFEAIHGYVIPPCPKKKFELTFVFYVYETQMNFVHMWLGHLILPLRRQKLKYLEFEVNLGCMRPCFKKKSLNTPKTKP